MYAHSFSPQRRPLFHLGKLPVHMVTLLVMIHGGLMVFFALGGPPVAYAAEDLLGYRPEAIFAGKLWTLVSYIGLSFPSFWSAVSLVFFFMLGREVENRFGRIFVAWAYVWIAVVSSILLLLFDLALRLAGSGFGWPLVGPSAIHFAFFIGFCLIEPEARFFGMFPAKWFALFFVVINSLSLLFARELGGLVALWAGIVLMYGFMRQAGLPRRLPFELRLPTGLKPGRWNSRYRRSRRRLRVVDPGGRRTGGKSAKARPSYRPKLGPKAEPPRGSEASASVDHLLEKISREGMASLTDEERRLLDEASSSLSEEPKKPS